MGPVTTKAALLQALRSGPGYGSDLIRRLQAMAGLKLRTGRVYPALRALHEEGLIVPRRVSPGGARGARSRTYYELTSRGVGASTRERRILVDLVHGGSPPAPGPAETSRMARRLLEADDLAELGLDLRRAMIQAGR